MCPRVCPIGLSPVGHLGRKVSSKCHGKAGCCAKAPWRPAHNGPGVSLALCALGRCPPMDGWTLRDSVTGLSGPVGAGRVLGSRSALGRDICSRPPWGDVTTREPQDVAHQCTSLPVCFSPTTCCPAPSMGQPQVAAINEVSRPGPASGTAKPPLHSPDTPGAFLLSAGAQHCAGGRWGQKAPCREPPSPGQTSSTCLPFLLLTPGSAQCRPTSDLLCPDTQA